MGADTLASKFILFRANLDVGSESICTLLIP